MTQLLAAALSTWCIVLDLFATYGVPDAGPREAFNRSKTAPRKWVVAVMLDAEP